MRTWPLTIPLLLASGALLAAPAIPRSGETVDETHAIAQLDAMPMPCVAIATGNATLYLSLQRLTDIAAAAPTRIVTEEDAIKVLPARRASALLARFDGARDENGCLTLPAVPEDDSAFAVLGEIRDGAVFVQTDRSRQHVPTLNIRYLATRRASCGSGMIYVALPGRDANELALSWWTSYGGACPGFNKPSA